MLTLIRFNKQKNKGIFFDEKKNKFIKFFLGSDKEAISVINSEVKGYVWYFRQLKKSKQKLPNILKKKNSFEIGALKGKQFRFWKNNIKNKKLILDVLSHYSKTWPKKKKVPFHGDLTIENIIFLKDNLPFFIDWEDFNLKKDWGLDICYFLISLITLPALTKKKNEIDTSDLKNFKLIWNYFFRKKDFIYLKDPINFIRKVKVNQKNNFFFKITNKMKKQIYHAIA